MLLALALALFGGAALWWYGPWNAAKRYERMSLLSLRQTLDQRPNDVLGWRILGLRLARSGDGMMAEPALTQAYALNPKDVEAATALAEILIAEKRYGEAFELLKRATAQSPRSVQAQMALGRLYRIKGAYLHAAEAFAAVTQADPTVPEAWYDLAQCYLETQRNAQAQEAIDRALQLVPNKANYLSLKGSLQVALGNVDAGIATVQQAALLAPADLKVQTNYLTILLTHHRSDQDLEQAEQVIGTVEQIDPQYALLSFEHGELERLRKHWAQSARFLERSVKTAPAYPEQYYSLSQVYRRLNRIKEADQMQAIYQRYQDLQQQIDAINVKINATPNDIALYARLSDAQVQQGDVAGAIRTLKSALEIRPDQASIKARVAQLQRLLDTAPRTTP